MPTRKRKRLENDEEKEWEKSHKKVPSLPHGL